MTNEERQALLDNVTPEDLAKIEAKTGNKIKVDVEDIIEAEFLMKMGFEAYWAIWPNKDRTKGIDLNEMMRIIAASRKVDNTNMYINAQTSFIGAVAAQTKKPASIFKSLTAKILKKSEADS